ncbi:MAG TPA: fluoride efflux transporter CrcB [Dictyobacter sp.]|jgi:CrcB protein|nr:fluoride efflux transporter CrcB [Dictyobacter sp.]
MAQVFTGKRVLLVLSGGFCGTIARDLISLWIQSFMGKAWPFDILTINITGALILAFISTLADAAFMIGPMWRLFIGVGFLGAYTTFSSLALGDVTLLNEHHWWPGILYIILSLVGGIVAVMLGQWFGVLAINAAKQRVSVQGISDALQATEQQLLGREASTESLLEEEEEF